MVLLSNARHMAAGSPGYANGIRNPSASAQALTVPDDIFAAVPVETPTASSRQGFTLTARLGTSLWCRAQCYNHAGASFPVLNMSTLSRERLSMSDPMLQACTGDHAQIADG